jgi:glycosyltransferase involved in cell wall biosynthesis
MKNKLITLIIPCFNEAATLPRLVAALKSMQKQLPAAMELELLLIDDGSKDNTAGIAHQLAADNNKLGKWQILEFSRNFGKEAAMLAGLDHCHGDACIMLDADLQDPPELIPQLIINWQNGYAVVNAVRSQRQGDGWLKQISAHWFYRLFKTASHLDVRVDSSDYRLLDRCVIDAICGCRERVRFSKGFIAWAGFQQTDIFYQRPTRKSGKSAWSIWRLWNYALDGIFNFSTAPLRIWTYLGSIVALAAVAYTIFIILWTILGGHTVEGYASIVALLTFLGGIQMMGLGLLGEYIGRIYLEAKQRPSYLIKNHMRF